MSKATRKKAMKLKAAHAHSFTHSSGASTPTSLSVPPSPHRGHSETSSHPPTPLIGPNTPEEISSELDMLADLYQGDDQPAGKTQRNIPSENDDGYGMDDLVAQYNGYELVEAMGLDLEREDEFLRALGAEKDKAYGSVKKNVSVAEWRVAETQSLGYHPGSVHPPLRTMQRHAKASREVAEYNQEVQKSSVFQASCSK